jgi:hypothetical protein
LRNRFIIGANADDAGVAKTNITGSPTQTGGSKDAIVVSHTHTGTTNTAGSHQHVIPHNFDSATAGDFISGNDGPNNMPGNASPTAFAGDHTHTFTTDSAGSSGTNANLVPYYALAFIMKA